MLGDGACNYIWVLIMYSVATVTYKSGSIISLGNFLAYSRATCAAIIHNRVGPLVKNELLIRYLLSGLVTTLFLPVIWGIGM